MDQVDLDPERGVVEQRFEELIPMAHRRARYWERRHRLPEGELLTQALLGAWDAAQRFDESFGASLRSYARTRIDGQVIDERRHDVPWSRHQAATGSIPQTVSLDLLYEEGRDGGPLDQFAAELESGYAAIEADLLLRAVLVRFPYGSRELEVLTRNVIQGEPLWRIAQDWGVTESRACQIKRDAHAMARQIRDDMAVASTRS